MQAGRLTDDMEWCYNYDSVKITEIKYQIIDNQKNRIISRIKIDMITTYCKSFKCKQSENESSTCNEP